MQTWVGVLGVETEAVVGSPDPFRSAEKSLRRQLDDLDAIGVQLSSVVGDNAGFEGLAAEAFGDLTEAIVDQLGPFLEPLEAVAAVMGGHADELDELSRRAIDALRVASDRVEALRKLESEIGDLRSELQAAAEEAPLVGLELQAAQRRSLDAEDEVAMSHRAYATFRLDEEELNLRTATALIENELPSFEAVMSIVGALVAGDPVWIVLRNSLLEAGIDVSYPPPVGSYEHADGCMWMDNGVQFIEVGGPYGGTFAVGTDISPGVYSVMLHLLNGQLPDFRPWEDPSELSDAEFSAFWWAASTNWPNPGDAGQLQVSGINGSLSSYFEGGAWSPQPLRTINGMDLAVTSVGGDIGAASGMGQAVAGVTIAAIANATGTTTEPGCDDEQTDHGADADENHHHH